MGKARPRGALPRLKLCQSPRAVLAEPPPAGPNASGARRQPARTQACAPAYTTLAACSRICSTVSFIDDHEVRDLGVGGLGAGRVDLAQDLLDEKAEAPAGGLAARRGRRSPARGGSAGGRSPRPRRGGRRGARSRSRAGPGRARPSPRTSARRSSQARPGLGDAHRRAGLDVARRAGERRQPRAQVGVEGRALGRAHRVEASSASARAALDGRPRVGDVGLGRPGGEGAREAVGRADEGVERDRRLVGRQARRRAQLAQRPDECPHRVGVDAQRARSRPTARRRS